MSLIINMLKDLEKRHQGSPQIPSMETVHQHYSISNNKFNKQSIVIGLILFTTFLSLYMIIHKRMSHESIAIPSQVTVNKSDDFVNKQDQIWLSPVVINAVSFSAKDNVTEILFTLSHNTLYRIGTGENGAIVVSIDNAVMTTDLPTLIGAEVSINNISLQNKDGALKFIIPLKPGAFLQSVNINSEGKDAEFALTIANSKADDPEHITASKNNIKTPAMQTIIAEKYHDALKEADAGNKTEAMVTLKKLLQYYPDYQDVRVSLAAMILESGNPVKAREIIDDGLAITPDYLPLIELKARLLTSEGKIDEAIIVLQSEQPPISEAPGYHALIAALYNRTNNSKIAAEIYQKLVQINPHEGSWWFGLGVSMDKLGHSTDAIFSYTKAATEGRLNPQAMSFLQSRLRTLQEEQHAQK